MTLPRLLPLAALLLGSTLALTVPQRAQYARDVLAALNVRVTPCRVDAAQLATYDTLCAATAFTPDRFKAEWRQIFRRPSPRSLTALQLGPWLVSEGRILGSFLYPDGTPFMIELDPVPGEMRITWPEPTEGSRKADLSGPGSETGPVPGCSAIPGRVAGQTVHRAFLGRPAQPGPR